MRSTFMQHRLLDYEQLEKREKEWLAFAIAGAVISDRTVSTSQISWLEKAVSFLDQETADTLKMQLKKGTTPELEVLANIDRERAAKMYLDLVMITMESMTISKSEARFLTKAAKCLGIREGRVHEVLGWAHEVLKQFDVRESFVEVIAADEAAYL